MIAGTAAILILIVLAIFHIYWAIGGKAAKDIAVPSLNGRPVLKPTAFATALVAAGLLAISALLALRVGWLNLAVLPAKSLFVQIGAWLIAAVFALRAIGDFRYVGFFKTIREGRFARLDTFAYSPLCAGLALLIGISLIT
jgi:hypothetical protein